MPEVSIVIATLNGADTLRKAIESARNQTVRDIEIVVVDDGSTDGTPDLLAALAAEDARIKYVRLPQNVGVGAARNEALSRVTGEWITILDADDWYEPRRLEVLLKAARDFQADLVADNLKIYDHVRQAIIDQTQHGRKDQVTELTAKIFFERDNPLCRHPMGFIQPLIRRKFLTDRKIVYDRNFRVGEDFIFVAEILLQGARAFIVPGAYYVYVHRISPTTRKISPHSHSKVQSVFALFVRGCEGLLQKYGSKMPLDARHALLHRRRLLQQAAMYQEMRQALRQGRVLTAMKIVAAQPVILVLIGNIIIGWLAANARYYLRFRGAQA